MTLATYTLIHVVISLVGIVSGFIVVIAMLGSRLLPRWTVVFLASTVLTSVTGFGFPFHKFLPSHGVGIISLVALAVAVFARYLRQLAGAWRVTYVIGAVLALYLNFFVLIIQGFLKVHALKALAPTQSEPPFVIAQSAALILFVVLGILAARRFRTGPLHAA